MSEVLMRGGAQSVYSFLLIDFTYRKHLFCWPCWFRTGQMHEGHWKGVLGSRLPIYRNRHAQVLPSWACSRLPDVSQGTFSSSLLLFLMYLFEIGGLYSEAERDHIQPPATSTQQSAPHSWGGCTISWAQSVSLQVCSNSFPTSSSFFTPSFHASSLHHHYH